LLLVLAVLLAILLLLVVVMAMVLALLLALLLLLLLLVVVRVRVRVRELLLLLPRPGRCVRRQSACVGFRHVAPWQRAPTCRCHAAALCATCRLAARLKCA
jgi:hypothetical protein